MLPEDADPAARPQAAALNGSFDVFMLNFYTSRYVFDQPGALGEWGAGRTDAGTTFERDGQRIGPDSCAPSWFAVTPWAMRKMLNWVDSRCAAYFRGALACNPSGTACSCAETVGVGMRLYMRCWLVRLLSPKRKRCLPLSCACCGARLAARRYGHPHIIITENGVCVPGEADAALPGVLNDTFRIEFHRDYVLSAMEAVKLDKVIPHGAVVCCARCVVCCAHCWTALKLYCGCR